MIREMERIFETLKEDFNRKLAGESIFNIFGNRDDVEVHAFSETLSGSYEDINMDDIESAEEISSIEESLDQIQLHRASINTLNNLEDVKLVHEPLEELSDDSLLKADDIKYPEIAVIVEDCSNLPKDCVTITKPDLQISEVCYTEQSANNRKIDQTDCKPADQLVQEFNSATVIQPHIQQHLYAEGNGSSNQAQTGTRKLEQKPTIMGYSKIDEEQWDANGAMKTEDGDKEKNETKQKSGFAVDWSSLKEVQDSGILSTLSDTEIRFQEAMFEILSTEALYYHNLMVLMKHFFDSELFNTSCKNPIVTEFEKHYIFSNIIIITNASKALLKDLEQRWNEQKPVLKEICDIIYSHAVKPDFQNYINYIRNQQHQLNALKQLSENERFKTQLSKLESSKTCGKLDLWSFLLMPFRRLTKYQLMVSNVISMVVKHRELVENSEAFISRAEAALAELRKLLNMSQFEKNLMDSKTLVISLTTSIEFPSHLKCISFSHQEFLMKEFFQIHPSHCKRIRKVTKKKNIYLILFDELLIITKQKDEKYIVLDYCGRDQVSAFNNMPCLSAPHPLNSPNSSIIDSASSTQSRQSLTKNSLSLSPNTQGTLLSRSKTSSFNHNEDRQTSKRFSASLTTSFKSIYTGSNSASFSSTSAGSYANSTTSSSNTPAQNSGSNSKLNVEEDSWSLTFSIQVIPGQTTLFNNPLLLIAKSRDIRDHWVCALNRNKSQEHCKLQKSVSLHGQSTEEEMLRRKKISAPKKLFSDA